MNNQKSENEKGIDFSRFPIGEKRVVSQPKHFSLGSFKQSWQRMGKKNQIFTTIIVIAFILIIILLFSLLGGGKGSEKIIPTSYPSDYPPSAEEGGI